MRIEKFSGTVSSAYGTPLKETVKFDGTYEHLETMEEVEKEKEALTEEEILTVVNNRRKAAARQKATGKALDNAGIKAPEKDDPKVLTRNMVRTLTLAGRSEDEAKQIAKTMLGDKFAE